MDNCIFCKIVRKEIPTEIVFENDDVLVFPDLHPRAPVHLLIIPKIHIEEFAKVEESELFKKLFDAVSLMIKKNDLENNRYKITINGGGLQEVDHLHIHLYGKVASL
jgi:histidine triad (HIT) family protein